MLAKLEADKGLAEKIFGLETPEEVQSFLKTQGLEFSLEEIDSIKNALVKAVQKGELTDDDLDDVAGGIAATTVIAGISATITAANFVHNVSRGRW